VIKKLTLFEISKLIDAELIGDAHIEIKRISSIENPLPNSITFSSNLNFPENVLRLCSIIVPKKIQKNLPSFGNFLIVNNPKLAFADLSKLFVIKSSHPLKYEHKPAFKNLKFGLNFSLGKNVRIGSNCVFGNNVILEDNVLIGDNVELGHNVVISMGSSIGNNVFIDCGSIIGSEGFGNVRDNEFIWRHIHHLGNVIIKDNVMIGAHCTIDRGTINDTLISSGVIIDNQVHIAHNVSVGENSAIAAKSGIAGSSRIGKRNMIGGMVGVIDHIQTSDDVIISATSTVDKHIKEPGTYTGIMPISNHARWKRIALWITKLDKIAKFLNLKKI